MHPTVRNIMAQPICCKHPMPRTTYSKFKRITKCYRFICELPKAKAFGLLASTSLLFSKFKRIFKKSYILSTSVNSLCTTGTILKKFYDRKVFSICQLPTIKKFQRTNLIISTLKLKGFLSRNF